VLNLLDSASASSEPCPKALIVPHAGYVYSGPVAASAYANLRSFRDVITRVVLMGPAHYGECHGLATTAVEQWRTPLGSVPVDQDAIKELIAKFPHVFFREDLHEREHSLEVQVPFLQVALDQFSIIPLLAGEDSEDVVLSALEHLWGGPETLLVISSDLSHFHDSMTARGIDAATAAAILALEPNEISGHQACGQVAIKGLVGAARGHGLHPHSLDLRNSGDTSGRRDRVVGYGAFSFTQN